MCVCTCVSAKDECDIVPICLLVDRNNKSVKTIITFLNRQYTFKRS